MSLLLLVLAQGKPIHPTIKLSTALVADAQPVTAKEAREAFGRVCTLLVKVNGRPLGAPVIPALNRPATRAEIVAEMERLYKAAGPLIRFTPAPQRHDPSIFRIDSAQKSALDTLVTRGFVARIGPLAVGPAPGLTIRQFGDALGFYVSRLGQVTHMPSPKWTPMLKED